MTLQEQLAQPQKPTEFQYLPVFEGGFGVSLLGNQPSQTPARVSGKGPISETGLFVGNYDRLIQGAATAAAASGVLLKTEVASVGGVIANQLISGFGTFNGIIVNAETPARVASRPQVANAESTEMSWLVQNAQELGRHKGEWLLIRGQQLLAHSADFAIVRAAVREQRINSAFVYYVPTDEESNAVTI